MAAELVLSPEAESDIADAYSWYEARRIGLGEEFLSSLDACVEGVRRQPEMCSSVHESFRRCLLRRFRTQSFINTLTEESLCSQCFILLAIQTNGASVKTAMIDHEQCR